MRECGKLKTVPAVLESIVWQFCQQLFSLSCEWMTVDIVLDSSWLTFVYCFALQSCTIEWREEGRFLCDDWDAGIVCCLFLLWVWLVYIIAFCCIGIVLHSPLTHFCSSLTDRAPESIVDARETLSCVVVTFLGQLGPVLSKPRCCPVALCCCYSF